MKNKIILSSLALALMFSGCATKEEIALEVEQEKKSKCKVQ